ncbi:MAG TPA: pyridoxal-dependent decarboxylase [Thermoanaerobaculia bacterium]|nr:pyridoxal-dependent decarboxylase [Thermoanaerobaculia bacterium]
MTPEEFRRWGHAIVDWIADYRERAPSLPVLPSVEPGALAAALPAAPPETAEPFENVIADLDRLVVPATTHWQHPGFFAFFPSNGDLASVLGDFVSTGLGVVGLSWQACPSLTEVEEVATRWLRDMMGLSSAWSGVIADTASTATLQALLCARERATGYSLARGGLAGEAPLSVYCSEQSHSSVEKAALLAGFGRAHLRKVGVDAAYAMRPDALAEAVARDVAAGVRPCAVVATSGTTAVTAFDPLAAIAEVARAHGLWLHVDAAMAGPGMILPELRPLWEGVEGADSLVVNPHKWLGVSCDCSVYYVRDPEHLVRVMSTNPSYLRSAVDEKVTNYRDWGIPLGRRFRALKLWFLIRSEGVEGLRRRLRRDLDNARWLDGEVRKRPGWRVVAPVRLQTVCIRHEPGGLPGDALDRHTLAWAEAVNRSGEAFVTPATLDGRWMVRVSIGNLGTEREHVVRLWRRMIAEAEVD